MTQEDVVVVITDEENNNNNMESPKNEVRRPTTLMTSLKSSKLSSAPTTPCSLLSPSTFLHRHSKSRLSLREESTSISATVKNGVNIIPRFLRASFQRLVIHKAKEKDDKSECSEKDDNNKNEEDNERRRYRSSSDSQLTPDAYIEATLDLPVIPFAFPTAVIAEKMEKRIHNLHYVDNDEIEDKTENEFNVEKTEEELGFLDMNAVSNEPSSLEGIVMLAQQEYLEEKLARKQMVRDISTDEDYVAMAARTPVQRICHQDAFDEEQPNFRRQIGETKL